MLKIKKKKINHIEKDYSILRSKILFCTIYTKKCPNFNKYGIHFSFQISIYNIGNLK